MSDQIVDNTLYLDLHAILNTVHINPKTFFSTEIDPNQKLILYFISFLLAGFALLIWLNQHEKFPDIPPGLYVGEIRGIQDNDIYLLLDKKSSKDSSLVVIDGSPQIIPIAFNSMSYFDLRCCAPVEINLHGRDFFLIGTPEGDAFSGKAFEKQSRKNGFWKLRPASVSNSSEHVAEVLKLYITNDQLVTKKAALTEKVASHTMSLGRLKPLLQESQKLKDAAGGKHAEEQKILETTQEQFRKQQSVVDRLRRQVELGQRITSMGRLVALSRDSLEQDRRWFSGQLQYFPQEKDPVEISDKVKRYIALQQELKSYERRAETHE